MQSDLEKYKFESNELDEMGSLYEHEQFMLIEDLHVVEK